MKRFPSFLSIVLLLGTLVGCRPDDPDPPVAPGPPSPVVKVTVEPRWNGGAFDKNQVYVNAAGQPVKVQQLKMYLSRFRLMRPGGEVELFDADLFGVVDGAVSRTFTLPAGDYDEVRFGLGLPPELNHGDISQIPVNDPLGNNGGMYWSWATMYRFVVFDGRFSNDPDPTQPLPFTFSLHTGLDTLFRQLAFPISAQATAGDTTRLTVVVDIGHFFGNGEEVLDLSQGSQWHGTVEDLELGIRLADLQRDAITVE
ncbi:MAG TPA: MbnP family protein [Flavobacteriales bacterium]